MIQNKRLLHQLEYIKRSGATPEKMVSLERKLSQAETDKQRLFMEIGEMKAS